MCVLSRVCLLQLAVDRRFIVVIKHLQEQVAHRQLTGRLCHQLSPRICVSVVQKVQKDFTLIQTLIMSHPPPICGVAFMIVWASK